MADKASYKKEHEIQQKLSELQLHLLLAEEQGRDRVHRLTLIAIFSVVLVIIIVLGISANTHTTILTSSHIVIVMAIIILIAAVNSAMIIKKTFQFNINLSDRSLSLSVHGEKEPQIADNNCEEVTYGRAGNRIGR